MTGIDVVTAAELVAEIGTDSLPLINCKFAGIAPIICGSGNKVRNYESKQGNRELYDIIKNLAIRRIAVTRKKKEPCNPYFHAYYGQKLVMPEQVPQPCFTSYIKKIGECFLIREDCRAN